MLLFFLFFTLVRSEYFVEHFYKDATKCSSSQGTPATSPSGIDKWKFYQLINDAWCFKVINANYEKCEYVNSQTYDWKLGCPTCAKECEGGKWVMKFDLCGMTPNYNEKSKMTFLRPSQKFEFDNLNLEEKRIETIYDEEDCQTLKEVVVVRSEQCEGTENRTLCISGSKFYCCYSWPCEFDTLTNNSNLVQTKNWIMFFLTLVLTFFL